MIAVLKDAYDVDGWVGLYQGFEFQILKVWICHLINNAFITEASLILGILKSRTDYHDQAEVRYICMDS